MPLIQFRAVPRGATAHFNLLKRVQLHDRTKAPHYCYSALRVVCKQVKFRLRMVIKATLPLCKANQVQMLANPLSALDQVHQGRPQLLINCAVLAKQMDPTVPVQR